MPRLVILFLILSSVAVPCEAQPALSLDDVRRAYQGLNGLEASFTQVVTSDFSDDSTRIEGSVLLSGNRYRVRTARETVVANDSTTWIYTPADSQVVVNDAETENGPITPESFLSSSADQYEEVERRTARRNGTSHVVIELTARTDTPPFASAQLWVRPADSIVTRLQATDRNGSAFDLRLSDITANLQLADDAFRFSPPEGTEIVDLRPTQR